MYIAYGVVSKFHNRFMYLFIYLFIYLVIYFVLFWPFGFLDAQADFKLVLTQRYIPTGGVKGPVHTAVTMGPRVAGGGQWDTG